MAVFEDHVVIIFSILFLCLRFLSRRSRLRQSLFLLMRTTQISKAVLSTIMLISRRRQSVLHRRRMNRPRVWVYPRDQRWFGEILRNPAMHGFFREHFQRSFDSFQALCRILSPFMAKRNTLLRAVLQVFLFLWSCWVSMSYRSFHNSLLANEVNSITIPARAMFQDSKSLGKLTDELTDLRTVTRIGKDTNNPAE